MPVCQSVFKVFTNCSTNRISVGTLCTVYRSNSEICLFFGISPNAPQLSSMATIPVFAPVSFAKSSIVGYLAPGFLRSQIAIAYPAPTPGIASNGGRSAFPSIRNFVASDL